MPHGPPEQSKVCKLMQLAHLLSAHGRTLLSGCWSRAADSTGTDSAFCQSPHSLQVYEHGNEPAAWHEEAQHNPSGRLFNVGVCVRHPCTCTELEFETPRNSVAAYSAPAMLKMSFCIVLLSTRTQLLALALRSSTRADMATRLCVRCCRPWLTIRALPHTAQRRLAHLLVPMSQKVEPNTSAMMTVNADRTLLYCTWRVPFQDFVCQCHKLQAPLFWPHETDDTQLLL